MVSVDETVGRYERPPKVRNEYTKILQNTIKEDEVQAEQKEWKKILRSAWSDQSESKADFKRCVATKKAIQAEVQQGGKAIVLVRRRALQQLFAQEEQQYEAELATLGKTFHKERL